MNPGNSVHITNKTPDQFLHAAFKVIRKGHGYPSVFNPEIYIAEMLAMGKSLQDAREGGCSGCIEVSAFGKEAFLLTGYLKVPKILEVTLNNGIDPVSGKLVCIETGDPRGFNSYDELYDAFVKQLNYIVDQKIRVSNYIEKTASFIRSLPGEKKKVNLLPYHNIASRKYEKIGCFYQEKGMTEPSPEELENILQQFKTFVLDATIGG